MPVVTKCRQRGVALVELALLLPIILSLTWLAVDLLRVNLARATLEKQSHMLAATIAQQTRVSQNQLTVLSNTALTRLGQFELVIGQVNLDASVDWFRILGTEEALCQVLFTEEAYAGELPQIPQEDDDDDSASAPVIVVQLCQAATDLDLFFPLLQQPALENIAQARVMRDSVTLEEDEEDDTQ